MIRYIAFCKIIECGSFTKAAEALGYTQAAISQMMRSLEGEYSMTLLTRTRVGVRLTPEGSQLYPAIQKYVSAYRELGEKVGEINGLESGELRIGTFSSMSQHLLPGLMSDFSRLYPKINFVLSQGNNTTLPEWIRSGTIDFGFVYPEAASGLDSRPLVCDDYIAVFPEGHPYAEKELVSLKMMAKEPLIILDEGGVNTVLSAFTKEGLSPQVKFRIQDDYTVLSMVEKGIGVSILPSVLLRRSNYKVKTVPIDKSVTRTICVTCQDPDLLTMSAKKFIKYMYENLGKYIPEKYIAR